MPKPCSVEDCAKPSQSLGWCLMHYTRWRRHGTVNGPDTATCPECGGFLSVKRTGRCYHCHWRRAKEQGRVPGLPRRGQTVLCLTCGAAFYTTPRGQTKPRRFCSHACSNQHKRATWEERFWAKVQKGDDCWLWVGTSNGHYGQFFLSKKSIGLAHRVSWELANGPIPKGKVIRHRCDVKLCVRPDHLRLGDPVDNMADRVVRDKKHPRIARNRLLAIKALHAQGFEPEDISSVLRMHADTIKAILTNA